MSKKQRIRICGPKDKPKNAPIINVTSSSKDEFKALSPFFLSPVKLYGNFHSITMENAWQYAKVYKKFTHDPQLNDYFKWAMDGWASTWANRYPMGKGAIPEYSLWDGKKLDYIEARKEIYTPLYTECVLRESQIIRNLADRCYELLKNNEFVYLFDYDGYDNVKFNINLDSVIDFSEKKMGHAFVLAKIIENML